MKWSRDKALKVLGFKQVKFEPWKLPGLMSWQSPYLQGYASYTNGAGSFAVNPNSEFKGAAGLHELGHLTLKQFDEEYGSEEEVRRHEPLRECEACAVCIICLKALGGKESGVQAQQEHYDFNKAKWGKLPDGFQEKVSKAAQTILEAGRVE